MISYVKGTLSMVTEDSIVVETGGIGICIFVPLTVIEELPGIGEEVLIHTYLKVSEDALTLFGFNTRRDLDMFKQLIGVSGIGPKGALSVLSTISPDDLRMAVLTGDDRTISRAPGIGTRTAQRIILDLKGKISLDDVVMPEKGSQPAGLNSANQGPSREAMEALIQLGYSASDAGKAIHRVSVTADMDSEAVLKEALKNISSV